MPSVMQQAIKGSSLTQSGHPLAARAMTWACSAILIPLVGVCGVSLSVPCDAQCSSWKTDTF